MKTLSEEKTRHQILLARLQGNYELEKEWLFNTIYIEAVGKDGKLKGRMISLKVQFLSCKAFSNFPTNKSDSNSYN